MNTESPDLIVAFREALTECKRLYTQAARVSLQDQPSADNASRHDMIRRMVDLHQGLLVKIFTSVRALTRGSVAWNGHWPSS